jgi:hypothetical protein
MEELSMDDVLLGQYEGYTFDEEVCVCRAAPYTRTVLCRTMMM